MAPRIFLALVSRGALSVSLGEALRWRIAVNHVKGQLSLTDVL